MIQIRWHARGGQGGFTAAKLLGYAVSVFGGSYAQAFPSFGPERRGAPVLGFTRIDDKTIRDHSQVYDCDYVLVLDDTLLDSVDVTEGLIEGGSIFINTALEPKKFKFNQKYKVVTANLTDIALEILGSPISNTAMMGVIAAKTDFVELDWILKTIEKEMPRDLREKNMELVKKVYYEI